jgi:hypothetical protein
MAFALWTFFGYNPRPPEARPRASDTGVGNPAPGSWPAGVPCPPPNWPRNVPLPCVPNNVPVTPTPPADPTAAKDAGAAHRDKDAGSPLTAANRTLERQAVDAVAAGNNAEAASIYEELSRRDPNNKVYAEAARISKAKIDGGAP